MLSGAGVRRGLLVHVGVGDGSLAIAVAKAEPMVVLAMTADEAAAQAVRGKLAAAGVHGQATAAALDMGRIPLADDSAAVVVCDLDAKPGVTREELLRVLRPQGSAWLRQGGAWQKTEKPRPSDIDNWGQYHHDAAMSNVSGDRKAGPAYGIQWLSGPQVGGESANGVRVAGDVMVQSDGSRATDGGEPALIARDAWSGLPLWRRTDMVPATRYALMADRDRVYVYPAGQENRPPAPCLVALDARTGKTVMEYREGLTFAAPATKPANSEQAKQVMRDVEQRCKDFTTTLTADGTMVQKAGDDLVVVNAATGMRLWAAKAEQSMVWMHPVVIGPMLYVIEGLPAESCSYTHWPIAVVKRIRALALADGKPQWTFAWPQGRDDVAAYNMVPAGDHLALMVRGGPNLTKHGQPILDEQGKPVIGENIARRAGQVMLLMVDTRDGRETYFGSNGVFKGRIGGGHSSARILAVGNRLWFTTIISLNGSVSISDPGNAKEEALTYGKLDRPVGCTSFRATPNWLFGSLTTYAAVGEPKVFHTDAARTVCDVGAFPANGMTYIGPNHCFCEPYLPGTMTFHSRRFAGEQGGERLERGQASAAPAKPGPSWPMYLCDNRRSAWTEQKIPNKLAPLWTAKPAGEPPADLLARSWADHWCAQGPVTQASLAEGVAVVGLSHRQQVLALDPASGAECWRAVVDGRIDSAPTIYQGLVLFGTRNGWLYALNRDSGALVWRFRCEPRRDLIAADGQLESAWPMLGSVTADERGIYAFAGRHTDADGGLWWWHLDLGGKVLNHGRVGSDDLKPTTPGSGAKVPTGMNNIAVMDGDLLLLPRLYFRRTDQGLERWTGMDLAKFTEPEFWAKRHEANTLVPGNQGLLNRVGFLNGYKMSAYSFTQGRMYAWHGANFIMVGGAPQLQHRGGDGGSALRRMKRLDSVTQTTTPNPANPAKPSINHRGAEVVWDNGEGLGRGNGLAALAVAGDAVLVGLEVSESEWKERQRMPYRLQVLNLADGKLRQELPLSAKPIQGGIAVADGRVTVVTADGTVACFSGAE
ncbi:MAG: PQQ-binding-like beta-propeller repeat protein [Planctomycetota bacterium]|nr:PQQ-binding-like beta-propeller repeat protein [Planctomycetota bacterium]